MGIIFQITQHFNKRQYLLYLLLFVIAIGLFGFLQLDSTFADPDSFYHAKITQILAEKGAITEFPWLSSTVLKYNFVDHHFLYHLILIPFVTFFSPLIGLKIASILFASLAILIFFWFLRQLNIKGAFWYALFLLTINPFIFRLNLAKAPALAIVLFFVVIYFLFKRKYLGLILLSCLYVWLYGGWPIVVVLAVIYAITSWAWYRIHTHGLFLKIRKAKILRQNLLLIFSSLVGILAGLFFSPYFPKNLKFYWQQTFKIAVVNYQHIIGVGGEWYPYAWTDLFVGAMPFFLLLIFALAVFFYSFKKQSMNSWFFLVLTFTFLALTLKSRRYVEYFIPIAVCFSAISINLVWDSIKKFLSKFFSPKLVLLVPVLILLVLSPIFFRDLKSIKDSYSQGFNFNKFEQASNWLEQNSNEGDIVFHSDWDDFPILFYHNSKNYYIVGLDPTFMYEFSPNIYQQWVDITRGEVLDNMPQIIKTVFDAKYIFVDINQSVDFDRNLANNFNFKEVYRDKEAGIYQIAE